jgi:hypothetical protein
MKHISASELWSRIKEQLDARSAGWHERIQQFGQVQALEDRAAGKRWNDDEVQEALVKAVLSTNTDWSKIENVLSELRHLFHGYSLGFYAALNENDIDEEFVPWFKSRKAASMTLAKDLKNLIKTSRSLECWSERKGSAEDYFTSLYLRFNKDPKRVAMGIGLPESQYKLAAFGVPLAAEALRNMGFDLAKPDRHILRAAGSFGFISFRKWQDRSDNKPPQADKSELLSTMSVVEDFAHGQNEYVTYVDNAIWVLCARSGLSLSNFELRKLAGQTE